MERIQTSVVEAYEEGFKTLVRGTFSFKNEIKATYIISTCKVRGTIQLTCTREDWLNADERDLALEEDSERI